MDAASIDPRQRLFATLAIMLATTMQVLDTTIANVALPHMQGSLSATQDQISWVLTSYIVAAAIMTPPTGFIAGRIGRKNLLLISVVGFTVASMLCGITQTLTEMVTCRLVQGMFGASLVPLSQSIILDIYPREKHGSAMALWGVGIMVGPILGPTLGGYLTEYMNWRWVFYINVPFGVLAFLGIAAFMPEGGRDKGRIFDTLGFILLSIAIAALQLMLDRGQNKDWFQSYEILIECAVALMAFYFFVIHTLTADHPFLDRRVFLDRNFVIGLIFIFFIGLMILSTSALMPPYLENILGYPVSTTGLIMVPRGVGTMLSMMLVGRLIGRVDERILLAVGVLLVTFSLWQMTWFNLETPMSLIIVSGFIQGLGLGQVFIPLTTLAYSTLAPHLRTEAAGLFSLLRNVGSSIGVSIVFSVLARETQINHSVLVQHITPFNSLLQAQALNNFVTPFASTGVAMVNGLITKQAAMIAFLDDFVLMMWLTLMTLPMLLLLRKSEKMAVPLTAAERVLE